MNAKTGAGMDTPQLEYAGPRTPSWKAKPSPLLVGGAALALVFYFMNLPFTPVSVGRSVRAKLATSKTDVSNLDNAVDMFVEDAGRPPTDAEGLNALLVRPNGVAGWRGPYIKRGLPTDAWGRAYVYHAPKAGGRAYTILSVGPDGVEGTPDDIVNK